MIQGRIKGRRTVRTIAIKIFKRQHGPLGLFDALVAPALAAYSHVTLIATDFHFGAFLHEIAIGVKSRIDDGLASAITCALDLLYGIGNLKQSPRAFKQMALENRYGGRNT